MPSPILNKWSEIVQAYKRYIIEGGDMPSLDKFYRSLNTNRVNYLLKEFKGLLEETFLFEPYAQILDKHPLEMIKSVFSSPPNNHLSGIMTYRILVSDSDEMNACGYSIAAWLSQFYPMRALNPERNDRFILYNHTRGEVYVDEPGNLSDVLNGDYITAALILPDLKHHPLYLFVGRASDGLYMDFLYKEMPIRIEVSNKNKGSNLSNMLEGMHDKIARDYNNEQKERAKKVYDFLIRGITY